jgi:hypothetical protein
MAIGILAAVLGVLISAVALTIPRIVARHNQPEDHQDSLAYLASTARSAKDVIQANRGLGGQADGDVGAEPADAADPGQ